jgi:hypothetical protein
VSELVAGLDLKTIGIMALCLVIGFVIVWTVLSARSEDKSAGRKRVVDQSEPDDRPR